MLPFTTILTQSHCGGGKTLLKPKLSWGRLMWETLLPYQQHQQPVRPPPNTPSQSHVFILQSYGHWKQGGLIALPKFKVCTRESGKAALPPVWLTHRQSTDQWVTVQAKCTALALTGKKKNQDIWYSKPAQTLPLLTNLVVIGWPVLAPKPLSPINVLFYRNLRIVTYSGKKTCLPPWMFHPIIDIRNQSWSIKGWNIQGSKYFFLPL